MSTSRMQPIWACTTRQAKEAVSTKRWREVGKDSWGTDIFLGKEFNNEVTPRTQWFEVWHCKRPIQNWFMASKPEDWTWMGWAMYEDWGNGAGKFVTGDDLWGRAGAWQRNKWAAQSNKWAARRLAARAQRARL